jgi:Cysteine-rich domain/Electron transfer flavoprotein domain
VDVVTAQGTYAPAAWGQALADRITDGPPEIVVGPGSDRGNELLAHVGAILDQPVAANCVSVTPGDPPVVTRMRWGGSLLEEAQVHGFPLLLTAAPHAVAAEPIAAEIATLTPALDGAVKLARGHERRLAPAHRPGRADGDQDLAGDLHCPRDQRRDPAHGGVQGRQEAARDQPGRRGLHLRERRLRGDRGRARGRAGNLRGDQEGERDIAVAAALLTAAIAISGTLFTIRVRQLVALLRAAQPATRLGGRGRRLRNEATIVLGQRKLLERLGPGLIHAFIFWGFLVLIPTILIAMIGVVDKHSTLPWLGHQGWFALLSDIFATLVLIGVLSALLIRKLLRPRRFDGSHLGEADLILALIGTIVTSLLLWQATRIALGLNEWPAGWAPVSDLLSHLFADNQATRVLERVFVWIHVLTILTFLAYLPRSKHLHIATAFTCTECGRCQNACPAFATGKTVSPKLVIMGLRDDVFAHTAFNVWFGRTGPGGRLEPAAELGVRVLEPGDPAPGYLYWVGCASSFDDRARRTAESAAKLLLAAGVEFAILGPNESCTGDPARRIGNEYVFQAFAEQNVEALNDAGVTKIVANCPHCFNTRQADQRRARP